MKSDLEMLYDAIKENANVARLQLTESQEQSALLRQEIDLLREQNALQVAIIKVLLTQDGHINSGILLDEALQAIKSLGHNSPALNRL